MLLTAGVLGLAVLGALFTEFPGGIPGALAIPVPDHIHVVHRGVPAAVIPHVIPHPMKLVMPVQRRRIHLLDPRTALNLVNAHETRRRRGSKRPPPPQRGPPRPGPPRPPRWKGPPKRKGHGPPRDKPWMQATRGSSHVTTRVRYHSKSPRKSKTSKTKSKGKGKVRPVVPPYADGYAEDEVLVHDSSDAEVEEDRPRKRPGKSSGKSKGKSTYPKGWGPDGGYRVPAPSSSSPRYPPYGTDEEEPGTGHLDLEERFINQHNQFYRHGYPADSSEATPTSTQSKKKPGYKPGYYEDEEIEVAEAGDVAPDGLTASSTSSAKRQPSYRRPSSAKKTKYSLLDGTLRDAEQDSREDEQHEYQRRPQGGSTGKGRGKKQRPQHDDRRHQSMYHAKFREQQDDRSLSAAHFNYELSGAASETAHTAVNNHRPAYDAEPSGGDLKTADVNFFRTRKPQYWG